MATQILIPSLLIPDFVPDVEELLGPIAPFNPEERLDYQTTMQAAIEAALEIPLEEDRIRLIECAIYSVTDRLLARRFSVAA